MRTSCYLNTAVEQKLLWLIMPLIGNTVRGEPSGYCSKMCFQKHPLKERKKKRKKVLQFTISAELFTSVPPTPPICCKQIKCKCQFTANKCKYMGKKKTLYVRQGVRDYMENKHYKNCEILNKRGLNPEQLAWNKLFWRGECQFQSAPSIDLEPRQ